MYSSWIPFAVQMRTTPTVTLYTPSVNNTNSGQWSWYSSSGGWQTVSSGGTTASQLSAYGTEIVLQSAANLNACYTISGNYAASAEL